MTEFWYIAVEQFGPHNQERWSDYVNWAKLPQLKELISLDHMLCPSAIEYLIEEDWQYNIRQDFHTHYFRDLNYLISRTKQFNHINILAVVFKPEADVKDALNDSDFSFCGYDLIEEGSGISSINNCGGFDKAFNNSDVSEFGLIENYELASKIQARLLEFYPEEIHAYCDLWAIWKKVR